MLSSSLKSWLLLSVLAALLTIGLKSAAYLLTGSVGLLSDALESLINLIAAITAYLSMIYSARPADANHTYGHEKIEFFSAGLEGALVIVAGLGMIVLAIRRLFHDAPLEELAIGGGLSLLASLINGVVGVLLIRVGRRHNSIVLEADGKHLMTDVWTSVGVVGGLALVWLTRIQWLDSAVAILIGGNIVFIGFALVRRSFDGLMDHAIEPAEQEAIRALIRENTPPGTDFHALRTRQAGARQFVDFHLLVPGNFTVREAHDLGMKVEAALTAKWPSLATTVHLEPIEDEASFQDNALRGIEPPGR
ncbi:cation diffusion facilitator family transporter [Zavarzinella formosa]|uniref:cation diffusion facilitator family transporter n=1 Tax=Zavarzinella formosa TaxID=360055 RepID=UPI000300A920|nr:cation diffusion facilitator family transporter [Zavarzinella formosa]